MVLMIVMVLAILPLYWCYWCLDRNISMSPLEIAKALHATSSIEPTGLAAKSHEGVGVLDVTKTDTKGKFASDQYGSNYDAKELVHLLAHRRVNYGEISAGVLGMGPTGETTAPIRGVTYI